MKIEAARRLGLIVKHADPRAAALARDLARHLKDRADSILVDENAAPYLDAPDLAFCERERLAEQCDLGISLGGDGTLLTASHTLAHRRIPVIGINLGRLGFLVEIAPQDMRARIDAILDGEYFVEERMMLQISYRRGGALIGSHDACNDIAIKDSGAVRMVEMETRAGGVFVNTTWSDGLIVSTPTGSTAYALSSGGPLIEPTLEALLLAPICPHTLSYRPLVLTAKKTVEIFYTRHNEMPAVASIDGLINQEIVPGDHIVIEKAPHKLLLVQPREHDYFHTLRNKLGWSVKKF